MPLVKQSSYTSPKWVRNPHLNTLYAALFREVPISYERERIHTTDGDFLDLDWLAEGRDRLVVVLHGLEGDTGRPYMKGLARLFYESGWDVLAMNFRGCSGEPNRLLRTYHMGETDDLVLVLRHALRKYAYPMLALVGFSLGGNVTLKYLGEGRRDIPASLMGAVAISVPTHIQSASREIHRWHNLLYRYNFMLRLSAKMRVKSLQFPDQYRPPKRFFHTFKGFDDHFTAPVHGFANAYDYWEQTSSQRYLPHLAHPVLLINARDDTFLSDQCYPRRLAGESRHLHLEIPERGGHVGFVSQRGQGVFWSEARALEFLTGLSGISLPPLLKKALKPLLVG
jgi:hypothetical protein